MRWETSLVSKAVGLVVLLGANAAIAPAVSPTVRVAARKIFDTAIFASLSCLVFCPLWGGVLACLLDVDWTMTGRGRTQPECRVHLLFIF